MAFVELATGTEFVGRYRVLRRLASGGMGTVYEVVHRETERRRALKVMQSDLFTNAGLRERFRNEARVTAEVRSEHLVDVFDAGVDAATGMPFLVMELLIGEDLGRLVERTGPLAPREVVRYLSQVASALDKTHARSIVHRDLKPANLFLAELEDGSSRMKILDFGISKIVSEASSDGTTSHVLGTPAYMAPEQLLGEPVSPATDIHALGLIAYTLLVGESYWQQDVESVDNVFAFALRAQDGPRENPLFRAARKGRALPAAFGSWFERATAREPKARFARASEAIAALGESLEVRVSVAPLALVQGVSVDAAGIPGERSLLGGLRWLVVPAALLVMLGLVLVFRGGTRAAPAQARASPQVAPKLSAAVADRGGTLPLPAPARAPSAPAPAEPERPALAPKPAPAATRPREARNDRRSVEQPVAPSSSALASVPAPPAPATPTVEVKREAEAPPPAKRGPQHTRD